MADREEKAASANVVKRARLRISITNFGSNDAIREDRSE